ncbi:NAD(+) diphosphatase [Acidipropionibacterium virtanenii]|nr:NAD(+) diphosphatase [Acidipropionibacterium virtanenii]
MDRDDPSANAARWTDPGARLLRIGRHGEAALAGDLSRLATESPAGRRDPQRQLLIGEVAGRPWFVTRADPVPGPGRRVAPLRQSDLPPAEREIVWAGLAALNWHESAPLCPRCHGVTEASQGGLSRICTACAAVVFPRTDPAVISAVLDDRDRIVLARQPSWEPGRVSVLAGFVEAGEAAEHALVREVGEETSLRVTAARYISSQPWPFPRSLMLGYVARAEGDIALSDHELAEAAHYSRDQVRDLTTAGTLILPAPMSIARSLVDGWLADRLPAPESGADLSTPLGPEIPDPSQP